jgi:hypothetical protein
MLDKLSVIWHYLLKKQAVTVEIDYLVGNGSAIDIE